MGRNTKLRRANRFVKQHASFGVPFVPVAKDCPVRLAARDFQISSVIVALGSSYFQRLAHAAPSASMGQYDRFVDCATHPCNMQAHVANGAFRARLDILDSTVVYVACLHLAVKSVAWPRSSPKKLCGYRFNHLLMYLTRTYLEPWELYDLETVILRRLEHRLTPLLPPLPDDEDSTPTDATSSDSTSSDSYTTSSNAYVTSTDDAYTTSSGAERESPTIDMLQSP